MSTSNFNASHSGFAFCNDARAVAVLGLCLLWATSPRVVRGELIFYEPVPYLSSADSPLLADPRFSVQIEDFEDGEFNLPGVANSERWEGEVLEPGPETDSVDGDDGLIDGSGRAGRSFQNLAVLTQGSPLVYLPGIQFDFDLLSTHVYAFGFVWTDGVPGTTLHLTVVDNRGPEFIELPQTLGTPGRDGGTGEDTFIGFTSDRPLHSVLIQSSYVEIIPAPSSPSKFEIDHVQIGALVPEATSGVLAMFAAVVVARHRRQYAAHYSRSSISSKTRIVRWHEKAHLSFRLNVGAPPSY